LEDTLRRDKFDLVIPATDGCFAPVVLNRSRFESLAKCAIPNEYGFEHTYLKQKTMAMAERLGVPIPRTVLLRDAGELDDLEARAGMRMPVVVKAVSSKVWNGGVRIDTTASLVHDWDVLRQRVRKLLATTPVLVQDYFSGIGVGQEFLVEKGVILEAFQHERLHEPLGGGGSLYRRSAPLNQEMLKHSARMLQHMEWTGVAMVEYKQNPATGGFALMEINGRFWGSLPLAIAAGVDFPADLYALMVEGRKPAGVSYAPNVYCRNATEDVLWFLENWRADRRDPYLMTVPRRRTVTEWINVLSGREHWDSLTLDDPVPGLVDWLRLARHCKAKLVRKLRNWALETCARTAGWRWAQGWRFRRWLRLRPEILFMCYGNICRSPFAERYARRLLNERGLAGIEVKSAGYYPVSGRPTPKAGQLVSEEFGIHLGTHSSHVIDSEMIRRAGAVVCMDLKNYDELRSRYPEVRKKLFFLRPFASGSRKLQIADPWGGGGTEFRECYSEIAASLDGMIRRVADAGFHGSKKAPAETHMPADTVAERGERLLETLGRPLR